MSDTSLQTVAEQPYWQFKKGQSGNPNGRPKDTLGVLLRLNKGLPLEIFNAVYPLLKSDDETIVIKAAEFLRDTRDGKPAQMIDFGDAEVFPFIIVRPEVKKVA